MASVWTVPGVVTLRRWVLMLDSAVRWGVAVRGVTGVPSMGPREKSRGANSCSLPPGWGVPNIVWQCAAVCCCVGA